MSDSVYDQLEDVLRQIVGLRGSGASPVVLEALIDEARELHEQLPAGVEMDWASDIAPVAEELFGLASRIQAAIVAAGGIGDVHVACSPSRVIITGTTADEEARDNAQIIAAKLAPGVEIDNSITVL